MSADDQSWYVLVALHEERPPGLGTKRLAGRNYVLAVKLAGVRTDRAEKVHSRGPAMLKAC